MKVYDKGSAFLHGTLTLDGFGVHDTRSRGQGQKY